MAMVVLLTASGKHDAGLVVLLCYCGLLRIGEALGLRRSDVVFGSGSLVLLLSRTKTGEHQRVVLNNPAVALFVQRFLAAAPRGPDEKMCKITYSSFRTWFSRVAAVLGGGGHQFRSHSMRRGAATSLFTAGVPFPEIMFLGRWSSESSCRLYVRSAEAAMISIERGLSPSQVARVRTLASIGPQIFELLPGP